jgi:hypothetical protein
VWSLSVGRGYAIPQGVRHDHPDQAGVPPKKLGKETPAEVIAVYEDARKQSSQRASGGRGTDTLGRS